MKQQRDRPDSPIATSRSSLSRKHWIISLTIVVALIYLGLAYMLAPVFWKRYSRHHPSFDDNPRVTSTSDGHPGDAINVAVTGSKSQLLAIMVAANWFRADALGVRSDLKIATDTVLKRTYDDAPVSRLYLYGRAEDYAFEQPVGKDPRHRHHVRFWRSKTLDEGRSVWVGAATYDESVGLSHTTGQITHHTAADIDQERQHVFRTLQATGDLADTYTVPRFHTQREGKNGGGDRWFTDGDLWVGVIKPDFDLGPATNEPQASR